MLVSPKPNRPTAGSRVVEVARAEGARRSARVVVVGGFCRGVLDPESPRVAPPGRHPAGRPRATAPLYPSSTRSPSDASTLIASTPPSHPLRGPRLLQAAVTGVDLAGKVLLTSAGSVGHDYLVLATGSDAVHPPDGLAPHFQLFIRSTTRSGCAALRDAWLAAVGPARNSTPSPATSR